MARILVVDDQPELVELIRAVLEEDGHSADGVDSGQAALDRLAETAYDLVICDLQMPEVDGMAVYRAVERQSAPRPAVLLMTGYTEGSACTEFLQTSGAAVLSKPVGIDELRNRVRRMLEAS